MQMRVGLETAQRNIQPRGWERNTAATDKTAI